MTQLTDIIKCLSIAILCFISACSSSSYSAHSSGASSAYLEARRLALTALSNEPSPDVTASLLLPLDLHHRQQLLEEIATEPGEFAAGLLAEGVNSSCIADVVRLLGELLLAKPWTLAFADSMAKPQPGLLNGATTWLGSFDQCLEAAVSSDGGGSHAPDNSGSFSGSYCLMRLVQLASVGNDSKITATTLLTIGTCWPDSCTMGDATNATTRLVRDLLRSQMLLAAPAAYECRSAHNDTPLTPAAIAVIILLSIIGFCLAAGTGIDLYESSRARAAAAVAVATAASAAAAAEAAAAEAAIAAAAAAAANNFDSSGTGGDEDALISATEIGRDNVGGRQGCRGTLRLVLLCFSLRTNAAKLLSQKLPDSHLTCVHGIRFLSMSWVILGHTFLIGLMGVSNLGQVVPRWLNDWKFQAILNATVSVDTFFVLSGLLATYLFLRELDMRGGQLKRINWLRFYLHRYWRLTAPYMVIMAVYTVLARYLYDGPRYPRQGFDSNCETGWWKNLLYINNMFSMKDMCMAWSWYLANDMQFYLVSPIFLIPVAVRPALGAAFTVLTIVASCTAAGVQSTLTGQSVTSYSVNADWEAAYTRPWFRIAPYLVGCLAGALAHRVFAWRRQNRSSLRLHWALRLAGWAIAACLCLSVLYGLFDVERGRSRLSQPVASLYNCTFRLAWSLGVAWVVLACATGNGGWVAGLLSSGCFAPLSRLSYCAYLIHPALIVAVEAARRDTVQWSDWSPAFIYLGYLTASYVAAFGASLALESPLVALERLATGPRQ